MRRDEGNKALVKNGTDVSAELTNGLDATEGGEREGKKKR